MTRTPPNGEPKECPDESGTEPVFSIGELSEAFDITPRAIRFYEARGLLKPRREGQHRIYSRRDRARLALILRGKNLGFTLEDIAEYLALYDADPAQLTQTRMLIEKVDQHIASLARKRADLDRTLQELQELRAECIKHLSGIAGSK